jgi:hypothetical protein
VFLLLWHKKKIKILPMQLKTFLVRVSERRPE